MLLYVQCKTPKSSTPVSMANNLIQLRCCVAALSASLKLLSSSSGTDGSLHINLQTALCYSLDYETTTTFSERDFQLL